jgi:6-phosphogluconolactonase
MPHRTVTPVYIGTYTDGDSQGIYRLELDVVHGRLSPPILVAEAMNPSFLAPHPSRPVLYSVSEIHGADYGTRPSLLAYEICGDGSLRLINERWSGGLGACFASVHPAGTHVFVANYRSGSVAALPIGSDGALRPASSVVQHRGSSVHPVRQDGPHPHSVRIAPGNEFVLAADLGCDGVFVYRFDPLEGRLSPHEPPAIVASAGAGPRHLAVHPSGGAVFVINELDSTVTSYVWDRTRGTLYQHGVVSTVPDEFDGENTAAEVAVHPSGRFVYGSNRGHDSIAIFAIDAQTGTLSVVGWEPTQGRTPRYFGLDPSGTELYAANQNSDTVVIFRVDQATGNLTATGQVVKAGSPSTIVFRSGAPIA